MPNISYYYAHMLGIFMKGLIRNEYRLRGTSLRHDHERLWVSREKPENQKIPQKEKSSFFVGK